MNLCRLLVAAAVVFPQKQHEPRSRYEYRIILAAAEAIHTKELFEQHGEKRIASDPKIAAIINKYYQLTELIKEKNR